jgi:hypothetical protein
VISNAFPRVKIVTSMVDPGLNKEKLWIEPGIGNFGGKKKKKKKKKKGFYMNFCVLLYNRSLFWYRRR